MQIVSGWRAGFARQPDEAKNVALFAPKGVYAPKSRTEIMALVPELSIKSQTVEVRWWGQLGLPEFQLGIRSCPGSCARRRAQHPFIIAPANSTKDFDNPALRINGSLDQDDVIGHQDQCIMKTNIVELPRWITQHFSSGSKD